MTAIVVLDAGPLSLLTHPGASLEARQCQEWLAFTIELDAEVVVPEIADYELRRELLRSGRSAAVQRLDEIGAGLTYQPITTRAIREAASLWARARENGEATAPDLALDADVILAAQARELGAERQARVVVCTTNVAHLSRFVEAARWDEFDA